MVAFGDSIGFECERVKGIPVFVSVFLPVRQGSSVNRGDLFGQIYLLLQCVAICSHSN